MRVSVRLSAFACLLLKLRSFRECQLVNCVHIQVVETTFGKLNRQSCSWKVGSCNICTQVTRARCSELVR